MQGNEKMKAFLDSGRIIYVSTDHYIAKTFSFLQVAQMPYMKNIKAAVGKNNFLCPLAKLSQKTFQYFNIIYYLTHSFTSIILYGQLR